MVVELAVELLRQVLYALVYNAWAGSMLVGTNKNARFDWWLNFFESMLVALLLIFGFGMIFTTIVVFLIMISLKEFGRKKFK